MGNAKITWWVPSHYLNQCWDIFNSNLSNKFQWNLKRNSHICIQENAFENVACETAAILSRPQCVKAHVSFSLRPCHNREWVRRLECSSWGRKTSFDSISSTGGWLANILVLLVIVQKLIWHHFQCILEDNGAIPLGYHDVTKKLTLGCSRAMQF